MTETELQAIVADADTIHLYQSNPVALSYDANRKRVSFRVCGWLGA